MVIFGSASMFGLSLLEFAVTWWLQSTILLLAGLLAAQWVRHRGPATLSVIYRSTLLAVLVCPLATQLLSISGISLMQIDLRSRIVNIARSPAPFTANHPGDAGKFPSGVDGTASGQASISSTSSHIALPDARPDSGLLPHSEDANRSIFAVEGAKQVDSVTGAGLVTDTTSNSSPVGLMVAYAVLAVWLCGTVVFLGHLIADFLRSESLRRMSAECDLIAEQVCCNVAKQLNVRKPRVRANPFLNSPCLLGHWRPTVLVPEDTEPADYQQVFFHELAHLRRGDWLWNLISRVTTALLWCQPLTWLLSNRNAAAAEEVCDDYVLKFGGNREGYLRQLVEIAERTLPQPSVAGVAMVGFRSKLGHRANRILDTTRVLSTTTGRRFACFALIATLIATASVSTI